MLTPPEPETGGEEQVSPKGDEGKNQASDEGVTSCATLDSPPSLPKSINEVITLINSLPKPLSIACFIAALPRPLTLYATKSELSVQPAVGANNPRLFIFSDKLVITFALTGKGSETLEFSSFISTTLSVKGELAFPVTEALDANAPYARILRDTQDGTTCAGCHFNEQKAPAGFSAMAYASNALRPFDHQEVSLQELNKLLQGCGATSSERCKILQSLLKDNKVIFQKFLPGVPTLF